MKDRYTSGIGVDISQKMLESAQHRLSSCANKVILVQGDALNIPVQDGSLDFVFMFGGIHHVNNRPKLFSEIYRILKPGGRFIFREPADDFWLWKGIRKVVYRLSSALDHETERPLRLEETLPVLHDAGFQNTTYKTFAVLGFCLFMNSDVLVVNRLFRFVPGISWIVKAFIALDKHLIRLPGCQKIGLQVIGSGTKPQ